MEQIGLCLASSTRLLQQAGKDSQLIAVGDSWTETNQYCFYSVQVEDLLTFTPLSIIVCIYLIIIIV